MKPRGWTLENGCLKKNVFYADNLHLVEEGNIKLSQSITNIINPHKKSTGNLQLLSSKLFKNTTDFCFNVEDFPLLPSNINDTYKSDCSRKPVFTSSFYYYKPVSSNVRYCKPVSSGNVSASKPVSSSNVSYCKRYY